MSIKPPVIGKTLYIQRILTQTNETVVSSPIFCISSEPW